MAVDVTSQPVDKQQFHNITSQAKAELGVDSISAIADKGYYSASEFAKCKADNIFPIVIIPIWQQVRDKANRKLSRMKKMMIYLSTGSASQTI